MICIPENIIIQAASKGADAFLEAFSQAFLSASNGQLTPEAIQTLSGEQITLVAYVILRNEVMEGGFIQLIQNGYGDFIFLNPFAKAMRLWGAHDLSKLIYKGRRLYEQYGAQLQKPCTDEEFMALYEQYPEFDDLDDEFVEREEEFTMQVAQYVDNNLNLFAEIIK